LLNLKNIQYIKVNLKFDGINIQLIRLIMRNFYIKFGSENILLSFLLIAVKL